jgi:transporter family protein
LARLVPQLTLDVDFSIRYLSPFQHLLVGLKSTLVTSSWVCAYFAVKHLPLSFAGPLRSLSPLVTVLGALILFGEMPSHIQFFGMLLMLCGYLGFAWLGRAEGIAFHADRWVWLLLLGTCLGAVSGLYDKQLLQHFRLNPTTLQLWFTVDNVLIQAGLTWALWRPARLQKPFTFRWTIPLVGAFLICADQFYFRALAEPGALVSVVALVRRASVLVSFSVGGLLFREKLLKKKAVFLFVLLLGVTLLFGDSLFPR